MAFVSPILFFCICPSDISHNLPERRQFTAPSYHIKVNASSLISCFVLHLSHVCTCVNIHRHVHA